ncbi:hypothetical protein CQA49_08715 [Helicobacter sp. MIT 00-7814]|uniref:hypothetical protein n=1 Tax=unclassified Helicobacter TaxID=2593540 RepID=UPI000E1F9389|nr:MULTISPECIES: hypothetical protein [unclassified Helicobacter]RDU52131.1 hypothetical protein CQA49_08715 [Helicobacter sp. MIT 00-7814]RDU56778.1 hypothetical protein CQA37_01360 [Helicobacter sp. MIT 99-10781]
MRDFTDFWQKTHKVFQKPILNTLDTKLDTGKKNAIQAFLYRSSRIIHIFCNFGKLFAKTLKNPKYSLLTLFNKHSKRLFYALCLLSKKLSKILQNPHAHAFFKSSINLRLLCFAFLHCKTFSQKISPKLQTSLENPKINTIKSPNPKTPNRAPKMWRGKCGACKE